MHIDYQIGALTIHIESEYDITESAVAEQFRCVKQGRLHCVCRVEDTLGCDFSHKIYSEENLDVFRTDKSLEMVRYARVPDVHPYMISSEYEDGRRIDIVHGAADLNWSNQIEYFWRSVSLRHCLIRAANLLLHASFIEMGGRGILFAGSAAMEQVTLWARSRGASVINSGRAVIGVENGRPMAYGVPLLGAGHICKNQTLPLAAVVLSEKGNDNAVTSLTGPRAMAAVRRFVACDAWRDGEYATALSLLNDILRSVVVLEMRSTGDEAAGCALEKALKTLR